MMLDIRFEVTEFGEVGEVLACGVAQWFLEVVQVGLEHSRNRRVSMLAHCGF
jgi:hypothetical protein